MSAALRRLGAWMLALADRLERRAAESLPDSDALGERIFELRSRIHAGYY